ncbi:MAG: hypothetical protein K6G52_01875 [Treponemataceae bacterium]|nr:hypothetical protein [Treponemataceae bacterium]
MKNQTKFISALKVAFTVFAFVSVLSFVTSCKSDSKEKKNLRSKNDGKNEVSKISQIDLTIPEEGNSFAINEISVSEFAPDQNTRTAISDYVSNLSGKLGSYNADSEFFDALNVYPIQKNYVEVSLEMPAIFAFSPEYSGLCTMGFCDESGAFCSETAFISVFTSSGNLLSVTTDYQLSSTGYEISLSNQEVYYIVVAKTYQDEGTDSVRLKVFQNAKAGF